MTEKYSECSYLDARYGCCNNININVNEFNECPFMLIPIFMRNSSMYNCCKGYE